MTKSQNIMTILEVEGRSRVCNFQETLEDSIAQAQNYTPGNDRLAARRVTEIKGVIVEIASFRELNVMIQAKI